MSTFKTSNVPLAKFLKFLEGEGLKHIRSRGGHYIYARADLKRSIPVQSHLDPVPEFIVLEILHTLNISSEKMWSKIKPSKGSDKRKEKIARRGKRSRGK